jgi:ATP-dependent Clp protease ATP-binding subunit ClpX
MVQTNFGITANTDNFPPDVNLRELIALLFASPNITVEQVKLIISAPSNVMFDTLVPMIRDKISELLEMQNEGIPDLRPMFSDKIAQWSKCFGVVNEEDVEYLHTKFHLNTKIFLQEIRKCLFSIIDSPKGLKKYVCRFIKGQDETVKSISIPFYNHLLRVQNKINPPQNAVCLIGNTGVGKTETIKRFADVMNVPIIRVNLGNVVPNGIVGTNIAKQISFYVNDASEIEKYKYAVLHFSELDKLAQHFSNNLGYGMEIQKELLGFFDKDSAISLKRNKDRWDESIMRFPVNDLLICFDGAFVGIESVIEKRLKKEHKIRNETHKEKDYLMRFLSNEDMIAYGIMPELLSRIGKVSVMNPITSDTLYNILVNGTENEISVHKLYCEQRGFSLEFTDGALKKIAELANRSNLGVRSIAPILNTVLEEVYYDPLSYIGKTLLIDTLFIEKRFFYDAYGAIIMDYNKGIDFNVISQKYGYTTEEIHELIITHTTYKK